MVAQCREGWVILDDRGRMWDKHLYRSEEAASKTAAACMSSAYEVRSAKQVVSLKPINTTIAKFVEDWIVDPPRF